MNQLHFHYALSGEASFKLFIKAGSIVLSKRETQFNGEKVFEHLLVKAVPLARAGAH